VVAGQKKHARDAITLEQDRKTANMAVGLLGDLGSSVFSSA